MLKRRRARKQAGKAVRLCIINSRFLSLVTVNISLHFYSLNCTRVRLLTLSRL